MTLMNNEAEFTASIGGQRRATEAHENAVHSGSASAELVPEAEVSRQPVGYQRRIGPAEDPA